MINAAALVRSRAVADAGSIGRMRQSTIVVVYRVDGQRLGSAPNGTALTSRGAAIKTAARDYCIYRFRVKDVDRAAVVADIVDKAAVGDGVVGGRAAHGAAVAVGAGAVEGVAVFKGAACQVDPAVRGRLSGSAVGVA